MRYDLAALGSSQNCWGEAGGAARNGAESTCAVGRADLLCTAGLAAGRGLEGGGAPCNS